MKSNNLITRLGLVLISLVFLCNVDCISQERDEARTKENKEASELKIEAQQEHICDLLTNQDLNDKKISTLKQVLISHICQVDSLNQANLVLMAENQKVIDTANEEVEVYKKEIATLKQVLITSIQKVDSLNQANIQLRTENQKK